MIFRKIGLSVLVRGRFRVPLAFTDFTIAAAIPLGQAGRLELFFFHGGLHYLLKYSSKSVL